MINNTYNQMDKYKIKYLAKRIVNHITATISGEKPATIITVSNDCDKLLSLWREFGHDVFRDGQINCYELRNTDRSAIVLFFNRPKLEEFLRRKGIKKFLLRFGYRIDGSIENLLDSIKKRYNSYFGSYPFPHEIGVLLGIPLKDVMGFMGLTKLPCTMIYKWKIYGNPEPSLKVIEKYNQSEKNIKRKLRLKEDPLQLINCAKTERRH